MGDSTGFTKTDLHILASLADPGFACWYSDSSEEQIICSFVGYSSIIVALLEVGTDFFDGNWPFEIGADLASFAMAYIWDQPEHNYSTSIAYFSSLEDFGSEEQSKEMTSLASRSAWAGSYEIGTFWESRNHS